MRRVWCSALPPERKDFLLKGEEAVHLRDVLRAREGDRVVLFNGMGTEYEGLVVSVEREGVLLRVLNRRDGLSSSPLFLTVGIALLKENRVDDLIRPLVELGVRSIRIYRADRSVPLLDEAKAQKKMGRWAKLAMEAMKQCGVNETPEIFFHENLSALLQESRLEKGWENTKPVFFWENTKTSAWSQQEDGLDRILAVFGPEGGFSEEEVQALLDTGFLPLGLGPRILRAPTAILAATALLQFRHGDLSLPPTGFRS